MGRKTDDKGNQANKLNQSGAGHQVNPGLRQGEHLWRYGRSYNTAGGAGLAQSRAYGFAPRVQPTLKREAHVERGLWSELFPYV